MDSLKETISTFDKYAEEYEGKFMNYLPYVDTYKHLSDLLRADASILDVACGPGNIAKFLLKEFPDRKVYGIDLSERMVVLARRNNPEHTFEIMDCRKISTLSEKYDGIVAGFCFPYLSREEVSEFISDSSKKLSPYGILYISFMEGSYESSGMQTRNGVDWICTYYHNSELIVEILEGTGFDVLDIVRKSYEPTGEPKAVDVFIYARAR